MRRGYDGRRERVEVGDFDRDHPRRLVAHAGQSARRLPRVEVREYLSRIHGSARARANGAGCVGDNPVLGLQDRFAAKRKDDGLFAREMSCEK